MIKQRLTQDYINQINIWLVRPITPYVYSKKVFWTLVCALPEDKVCVMHIEREVYNILQVLIMTRKEAHNKYIYELDYSIDSIVAWKKETEAFRNHLTTIKII